jgi:hypothetical protein
MLSAPGRRTSWKKRQITRFLERVLHKRGGARAATGRYLLFLKREYFTRSALNITLAEVDPVQVWR